MSRSCDSGWSSAGGGPAGLLFAFGNEAKLLEAEDVYVSCRKQVWSSSSGMRRAILRQDVGCWRYQRDGGRCGGRGRAGWVGWGSRRRHGQLLGPAIGGPRYDAEAERQKSSESWPAAQPTATSGAGRVVGGAAERGQWNHLIIHLITPPPRRSTPAVTRHPRQPPPVLDGHQNTAGLSLRYENSRLHSGVQKQKRWWMRACHSICIRRVGFAPRLLAGIGWPTVSHANYPFSHETVIPLRSSLSSRCT